MADDGRSGAAAQVARVREDVERWRRTRAKLGPMPAALWREASAVAKLVGVPAVASELRLNAARLWAHVRAGGAVKRKALPHRAPAPARFVELRSAQGPGASAAATDATVVELADGQGARLTVRLTAGTSLDVARLVQAFRRRA
jgi:hypothetical protein